MNHDTLNKESYCTNFSAKEQKCTYCIYTLIHIFCTNKTSAFKGHDDVYFKEKLNITSHVKSSIVTTLENRKWTESKEYRRVKLIYCIFIVHCVLLFLYILFCETSAISTNGCNLLG